MRGRENGSRTKRAHRAGTRELAHGRRGGGKLGLVELPEHRRLQHAAVKAEAQAQRALFAGDLASARTGFADAVDLYRRSYELAPPGATGRLIGMLKASVFAAAREHEAAALTREGVSDYDGHPDNAYALAVAGLIENEDGQLSELVAVMRTGKPEFVRAADAIDALTRRDRDAYAAALGAIVADFEQREHHVTKVPIADTAMMMEQFAARRGLAVHPHSPLLPELDGFTPVG